METDNKEGLARLVLEAAHSAWMRMAPVRARRRRYARYTYGDQWSDPVRRRNGTVTTEGEKASAEGHTPLTNNLIRRLVKAVVGRWRMEQSEHRQNEETGPAIEQWRVFNSLDELDARTLEEFLISGMAIHHVVREKRPAGEGVWTDNVDPDTFFINAVRDSRCTDMELVGRLLDISLGEVMMRFSRGDRRRAQQLKRLYGAFEGGGPLSPSDTLANTSDGDSFFHARQGRCRVIEAWTLECREALRCHDPLTATMSVMPLTREEDLRRENSRRRRKRLPKIDSRWEMATAWHCRMLAPDGTVLDEFDSPLAGGVPPFAVKLYPMVDGDVHSLVEDVIDQQRYVNRLISLMDRMMGTAAKGVLLYPTGCKPDGQKWEEVMRMWADPGGVIPYRPYQGTKPHQVVTPVADIGARDMLQTQMKMFEEVSGVTEALMGKAGSGVVGVDRYESEVRNASISVCDLLRTFTDFTQKRDRLISLA